MYTVVLVLVALEPRIEHTRARLAAKSPVDATHASLDVKDRGGAIEVGDLVAPGKVFGLVGRSSLEFWSSVRWSVSGHLAFTLPILLGQ